MAVSKLYYCCRPLDHDCSVLRDFTCLVEGERNREFLLSLLSSADTVMTAQPCMLLPSPVLWCCRSSRISCRSRQILRINQLPPQVRGVRPCLRLNLCSVAPCSVFQRHIESLPKSIWPENLLLGNDCSSNKIQIETDNLYLGQAT